MALKLYVNEQDDELDFSRMEELYNLRGGRPDEPHRHDFYTILVTEKAVGTHMIDFKSFDLGERQAYFISPGQVHQLIEEEKSHGYAIKFSDGFLTKNDIPLHFIQSLNLFRNYGDTPPIVFDDRGFEKICWYLEEIEEFVVSKPNHWTQAVGALVKLLLIRCKNQCNLFDENTQVHEAGNSILIRYKALIEDNFKNWHSTGRYAEALFISPDHLNKSIKALIGKTAKELIQARITLEAKRLLKFSPLSVKEIAFELGFSDQANFGAFFKKCTGYSPIQFQNTGF